MKRDFCRLQYFRISEEIKNLGYSKFANIIKVCISEILFETGAAIVLSSRPSFAELLLHKKIYMSTVESAQVVRDKFYHYEVTFNEKRVFSP